jgi:tetratricopeptide (TPR) repeat protein
MAEQEEPVRRRVALKVIKLGMDTRQVVARFEAERQALALMDHPNIAKVLDAGATATGRPYFVMELVRGIRITDYCDKNKISTSDRLKLFTQVCQAVQHAHQKGIIHRDIKPSNILVALHDGVPIPKVIDFGIAKATQGRLTDHTLFTAFEQFIGTPAYMSPEQAAMDSNDIDTRTDIYSLGVLLYEMLTGRTPLDSKELLACGLDDMRRTIREKEPMRPSTRLRTMVGQELDTTAKFRCLEPHKLIHSVSGDLDWIVMKCLEKDRARRYETASGLAGDVERHLENQPIAARGPSRAYRLQRLIRRNRLAFAAGAAVAGALLLGAMISAWQAVRARRASLEQVRLRQQAVIDERRAEIEAVKSRQVAQFLERMLKVIVPSVAVGEENLVLRRLLDETARRLSDDFGDQPELEAQLRTTIAQVYQGLGDVKDAEAMLRSALGVQRRVFGNDDPAVAETLMELARLLSPNGDLTGAEVAATEALAVRRHCLGKAHPLVAESLIMLGEVFRRKGDYAAAETNLREALAIWRARPGAAQDQLLASALSTLRDVLLELHKRSEAEQLLEEVLPQNVPTEPQSAPVLRVRAELRARTGAWRQAVADYWKLIELEPDNHFNYHYLAPLLVQSGDLEAYGRLCGQIRSRFGGITNNPSIADRMAKDCLILACAHADLTIENRLADVAVTLGHGYPGEPWFQFCKGLAEYRRCHYQEAAEWTQKVLAGPLRRPRLDMETYLVLAMARRQLNQPNDAKLALARALEISQTKAPNLRGDDLGDGWVDWLIAYALLREARALIGGQPSSP